MARTIHVLDEYYLGITALITVGYQLAFFVVAFSFKFDKLTDFAGGTNFIVLAAVTLSLGGGGADARQVVATALIAAWGARLSGFLLFRVLRTGKDDRFDGTRDRFFPFLGFWVFQMLWVWTVSLPVTVLNSPAVRGPASTPAPAPAFGTPGDVAGVVMFAVGLVVETVSDAQRFAFRSRNDKNAVCDAGLFRVSRHPNYFGEILLHFGIFTIAVSAATGHISGAARRALYATIAGPIFITLLLMFVSGLPLSERPGAKRRYEGAASAADWDAYARYLRRTSILIPFPPAVYERLPVLLKRTVFLEFPMYVFDPAKHAGPAKPPADEGVGAGSAEAGH
ncbi:DUF1295-domain-containing protein [Phialemonium atrogriseum]|uniref:DUF1295-domain-containing protein n=1 Tax=Phialemonium atrogriseum TaxID=1093897 RepID=A0AAJ0FGY6_9PEZI|nr:DUF1295-domain-containing protein [Phialemonium atrogriseum]KAK1767112.1 DUF1295-domain-containing protein [Phialemonium atrogriseum]